MNELKNAEDQAKKAMADAARMADELRQEQDHSAQIEKMRRTLELQVTDSIVFHISFSTYSFHIVFFVLYTVLVLKNKYFTVIIRPTTRSGQYE